MNELVFLEPNDIKEEPFTTSKVIAEHGKVQHHALQNMILKFKDDIEEFGKLAFEMRPSKSGQQEKVYHLNEEQATLLITYMKNTLPVRRFKKALVKQFYQMQKELNGRRVTRQLAKQERERLTDTINQLPESPHKQMKYKHYTDLVYKTAFGKTAKQLREEYGMLVKDNLRDRFSAEQNNLVSKLENQVSVLIELGYDYQSIKIQMGKNQLSEVI